MRPTRLASLLSAAVLSCVTHMGLAHADDPFDALFGDTPEAVDASTTDRSGRDDLNLISVYLDQAPLTSSLSAYDTEGGLCLLAASFFEAIEFPITGDGPALDGWFIRPERTISIDFAAATATRAGRITPMPDSHYQDTPDGWCLTLEGLSALFPLRFTYDQRLLQLTVSSDEVLPVEARLAREAARRKWSPPEDKTTAAHFPLVVNDYDWFGWPVADVTLAFEAGRDRRPGARMDLAMAGDVLKFTGHLRSVSTNRNGLGNLRLTMSRTGDHIGLPGGLTLHDVSFGDTVSRPLALLSGSRTGRGIVISNEPRQRPDIFDTTEIRGPLPKGWEAELYDGSELIAFATEPDANGEYVFRDVVLTSGYNRLTVKLHGPFGEYEERRQRVFVGSELWPENQVFFSAGLVDPDTPLLRGGEIMGMTEKPVTAQGDTSNAPMAYASVSYGLTDRMSARLDTLLSDGFERLSVSGSLFTSILGSYNVFRVASSGTGRPAFEWSTSAPLSPKTSLNASVIDFGDLQSEISGRGAARTTRRADLRTTTILSLGTKTVTALMRLGAQERDSGVAQIDGEIGLASSLFGYAWKHSFKWTSTGGETQPWETRKSGKLLISKALAGVRLRAGFDYAIDDGCRPIGAAMTAQKKLGDRSQLSLSLAHDFRERTSSMEAAYSHAFDTVSLSAGVGAADDGEWRAGINLSFSLSHSREEGSIRFGPPGLTRAGSIRARIFDDENANGVMDAGEQPIRNAQLVVANTFRDETSGEDGTVTLAGLPVHEPVDAAIKLASLGDPFLKPSVPGKTMTLRPGQVLDVALPVTLTGEADGTVSLERNGALTPVAGVTVEAVSASGDIVATAQSEFDGYFYLDGLPLADLTLRIAEQDLKTSGTLAQPLSVTLSRQEPSALGLRLKAAWPLTAEADNAENIL